ncbi:polymorphic toxin type 5 domain-containing protein [Altericista sp. CCNU0014]|uniref:polymorphic toxin type 5 domain-containing protein n=1 Tax=Altericista sp. CCNU0014 TaxID=3082949 RepID=UPI00384EE903
MLKTTHSPIRRVAIPVVLAMGTIMGSSMISPSNAQYTGIYKSTAACNAAGQALIRSGKYSWYRCDPLPRRYESKKRNAVRVQAPPVSINSPKTPIASKTLRDKFMKKQLDTILANPNHPLSFLVNYSTRNWKSRSLYSQNIGVQAGHTQSRWSLNPRQRETVALEDALDNQLDSRITESRGGFIRKSVVEIGGVPVMRSSAQTWESAGFLPRGTVQNAPYHFGYSAYTHP